jgi:RNA polymerase sigma factor (sigma-70 family)
MPSGSSKEALRDLRTLFRFGVAGDLSDGQLLDRFVARRDEAAEEAFAMLVERHGSMVMGVCRRLLSHSHDAEDAFQATFLVLARKAATIRRRETLASWLYGVALRTAKDARGRAARRRAREERVTVTNHVDPEGDDSTGELRSILDTELARLPEPFRLVVLLCELEGLSRHEASCRLGIPEGTLSSRLARAKAMLRDRLVRRGLFVTTASLTTALSYEFQAAAVSLALAESTTRAAVQAAAGSSLAGLVSASVHSLTEEVLKTMLFAKLKGIALGVMTAGAIVTGAVLAQDPTPTPTPKPAAPGGYYTIAGKPSDPDRLHAVEQKLDQILEALGGSRRGSTSSSSRSSSGPPDLMPEESVSTTRFTPPPNYSPTPAATPAPAAAVTHAESTDRLLTMERRLADVERRLRELERRLNATHAPSALPSTPAVPAGADNAPRAEERVP